MCWWWHRWTVLWLKINLECLPKIVESTMTLWVGSAFTVRASSVCDSCLRTLLNVVVGPRWWWRHTLCTVSRILTALSSCTRCSQSLDMKSLSQMSLLYLTRVCVLIVYWWLYFFLPCVEMRSGCSDVVLKSNSVHSQTWVHVFKDSDLNSDSEDLGRKNLDLDSDLDPKNSDLDFDSETVGWFLWVLVTWSRLCA